MTNDDVMKQAELAGTFLEEAGVRYFAANFKPEADPEPRALVLAGWAMAVLAYGVKIQNVLNMLNLAKQIGLTEEELTSELNTSFGLGTERSESIRSRIAELRQLEKLGENK